MSPNRPTIRDVAKAASVSLGTASRVINGYSTVKPEIRARVTEAIKALNYMPNPMAQSMRTGSTRTIGCVLRSLKTPVMADFVKSAEQLTSPAGYALMLANNSDSAETERIILQAFSKRSVDGLLLTICDEEDTAVLPLLRELDIPIVLLDRKLGSEFDSVIVDHCSGLVQATEYLLGLGHRRIALLAGNPVVHPARDSIAGFKKAHKLAGLSWEKELVVCSDFWDSTAYAKTHALLASDNPPTAIISGGTMMLPGVLRAVRESGLKVPEDISLITGYDSELAQLVTPAITAIQKDYSAVGALGGELLLQRLNQSMIGEPRCLLVPSSFIERNSCAQPKTV
ncbi:MAG: LacI family DNA-binding transcriptional regulator [Rhodobacteraceae bacterium]|nr:LacI family DNA-binding transcriptional regulator [Paracoccaceae bacterium]